MYFVGLYLLVNLFVYHPSVLPCPNHSASTNNRVPAIFPLIKLYKFPYNNRIPNAQYKYQIILYSLHHFLAFPSLTRPDQEYNSLSVCWLWMVRQAYIPNNFHEIFYAKRLINIAGL